MNKKTPYAKIAAFALILVVIGFFIKTLLLSPAPITGASVTNSPALAAQTVTAEVKNGVQEVTLSWGKLNYNPEVINVKKGIPVKITADTSRLQGCFRSFRIPELGVTASFSETNTIVEFTPQKTGTFTFGCSMGMGNGKLVVR